MTTVSAAPEKDFPIRLPAISNRRLQSEPVSWKRISVGVRIVEFDLVITFPFPNLFCEFNLPRQFRSLGGRVDGTLCGRGAFPSG